MNISDPKIKSAKNNLRNSMIGISIGLMAYLLITNEYKAVIASAIIVTSIFIMLTALHELIKNSYWKL
jgi:hypothetical protein